MQSTTFLHLPYEVQHQIINHIVCSDHTFRLKPCRETAAKPHGALAGPLLHRYQLGASTTPVPVSVLTLLLIHPKVTSIVVGPLGVANSFSFPDSLTLSSFAKQTIGSMCALHIRNVSLDACGLASISQTRSVTLHRFDYEPDLSIADAIRLMPALKELTLGGIGPEVSWRIKSQSACGRAKQWGESGQYWDLRHLEVLRRIVGPGVPRGCTHAPEFDPHVDQNTIREDLVRNPLEGGRIVYWTRTTNEMPRTSGLSRYMGVRILKRGADTRLATSKFVKEEELTNLDALMQEVVELQRLIAEDEMNLIPQSLRDVMATG